MRQLRNYSIPEWIKLSPPIHILKELRNDAKHRYFLRKQPETLSTWIEDHQHLNGKNLAIIVAFNSPWVLKILLPMLKQHIEHTDFLIIDNSNRTDLRAENEAVCKNEQISYFGLPKNPERHPSRSHGITLNWIYYNILSALKPKTFSFIDHDLIPFVKMDLTERLGNQPFYGPVNHSPWAWTLWAGYTLMDFSATRNSPLNFNYDRANGLDTGGRNWWPLYEKYNINSLRIAPVELITMNHPTKNEQLKVDIIDSRWLHLSGVTSNEKQFTPKIEFYNDVFEYTRSGGDLKSLFELPDSIRSELGT